MNPESRRTYGPHRRRYDGFNHARSLTCSCFQQRALLNSDRSRQWLVEAIARARDRHGFHLWAFVVMPEHFHLLIYPQPCQPEVAPILKSIKQSVTRRALMALQNAGTSPPQSMRDTRPDGRTITRFWQRGGGYDRNLWSPKHIWETIDYIHMNPVRRGLCGRPEDWPWSSARAYAEDATTPLPIDSTHIPHRRR